MRTVEAIFSGGVFRPLGEVSIAENQRVRLTIESAPDTPAAGTIRTAQDLLGSNLVGVWADRTDIEDSQEFARQLREEAQRRHGSEHASG